MLRRIISMADSDSGTLDGNQRFRLARVNGPEKGDPLYDSANYRTMLAIGDGVVDIDVVGIDEYDRMIINVIKNGRVLNDDIEYENQRHMSEDMPPAKTFSEQ